ncbi:InlB B-repeat-containing protein [Anaerostipes sp.]|uniref:InlB B-repeat-containing protein n=1 Tax=Anaerostipes sp. TaxID=1872530 RepID=UPI0025C67A3A|nr:InlB B-repeat-containing protein [Anaerostipes sp.]MBS7009639.1 InlB B-repeat-containing protein [Anaerostipes sp.]
MVRKKAALKNGQTLLDVSLGDIRITETGAEGGGLDEKEDSLNKEGYWINGNTDQYNIIVDENVKTNLTLEDVKITCDSTKMDCINVSHADVTITLLGENELICNAGNNKLRAQGCALAKDGMDGFLTIQCQKANVPGHKCDDSCGSLTAKGNPSIKHAGAIGNTVRNSSYTDIDKVHMGFANFTIKGGNIEASGGAHCPGIGSACVTEDTSNGSGYTKNIRISGGNVKATGTDYGSGIGSGYGNKVDGIYITGGTVTATGGTHAPGIGASDFSGSYKVSGTTEHLEISGGDTVVTAVGDQSTNMPGIGSARGESYNTDVAAVPDEGFQGYIQDGESEDIYEFSEGTPFSVKTGIKVGRFFTMVYFGPFRDKNEINSDTNEQIGANNLISKTGGKEFTSNQLKQLIKVTGKKGDGSEFSEDQLTFVSEDQIKAINDAKKAGKTGEYPLTVTTPNGTRTTVTVYLKDEGTDSADMDPSQPEPTIGADSFLTEAGGAGLTESEVRQAASVQGKDKNGTTHGQDNFLVNQKQLEAINQAKTQGKAGTFPLTFTSPDGKTVEIKVTVYGAYDEIMQDSESSGLIRGFHVISKTGGLPFLGEQLKEMSRVNAVSKDGAAVRTEDILIPDASQLEAVNRAKTAGETGDFPLTFATEEGLQITIQVYLRKEGTDGAASGEIKHPSIGANNAVHPSGGAAFTEEELTVLCGAKGKNENGDNVDLSIDKKQMEVLNEAKKKSKTGTFSVTFFMEDGMNVQVTVTLTGKHTVIFDSDGGDYQPPKQTVSGGETAVKPKDPKKTDCKFDGWYLTDESGKEIKWDFNTPVHENITLKAKWTQITSENTSHTADTEKTGRTKPEKGKEDQWNYKELGGTDNKESGNTAKTGDEGQMPWMIGCLAGTVGICFYFLKKKKGKV